MNWAPGDPVAVNPYLEESTAQEKHGKIRTISLPSGMKYLRYAVRRHMSSRFSMTDGMASGGSNRASQIVALVGWIFQDGFGSKFRHRDRRRRWKSRQAAKTEVVSFFLDGCSMT